MIVEVAEQIEASGATEVNVTGHTDSQGSPSDNQVLSEQRAESVASALSKELPDVNITAEGKGEDEPVASNDTEVGQAKNRRVSIGFEGAAK